MRMHLRSRWQEHCVAWMELPEYEEEHHAESC
nr:MAG TPA: hypothetical protein [Caudoviricetes sp.]